MLDSLLFILLVHRTIVGTTIEFSDDPLKYWEDVPGSYCNATNHRQHKKVRTYYFPGRWDWERLIEELQAMPCKDRRLVVHLTAETFPRTATQAFLHKKLPRHEKTLPSIEEEGLVWEKTFLKRSKHL